MLTAHLPRPGSGRAARKITQVDQVRGRSRLSATFWFATLERAALLPTLGRLDDARRVERDLDKARDGELFVFMRQNVALVPFTPTMPAAFRTT